MKRYDVAAYIWPAYTGDEMRARIFWPEGIGEWQSVKNAESKGNYVWGRKPLWGYVNEADPRVMEMEIETAVDHGVNVFIYDWYWYDDRPFLENCLNDGFLKAKNSSKMKFYLMWANHDANTLWDKRNSHHSTTVWSGKVTSEQFERIGSRWIEKYFSDPRYYRVADKPVLSIYDMSNFINGLGGIAAAKSALERLNEKAEEAGLGGVHFQAVKWGEGALNISGVDGSRSGAPFKSVINSLPIDSFTNYQFVHFTDVNRDYAEIIPDVLKEWENGRTLGKTYFPHVSIGWDNNPRFTFFKEKITKNNTPEEFEKLLRAAKEYMDAHGVWLLTVNSWNEWTETSYLEPDNVNGYGYLEAIKRVFGDGTIF